MGMFSMSASVVVVFAPYTNPKDLGVVCFSLQNVSFEVVINQSASSGTGNVLMTNC